MKHRAFFVSVEDGRWTVARITDGAVERRDVEAEQDRRTAPRIAEGAAEQAAVADESGQPETGWADRVAAALGELGYDGRGICLGLPSEMVFIGQVDCTGLPRRRRRNRSTAMLYRLEDHLPLDAEGLTADFLPPVGGRSLGLAAETDRVRDLVDALAASGVETECVCATALLAAWSAARDLPEDCRYLVTADDRRADLLRLSDGRPVAWYSAPADGPLLVQSLRADLLGAGAGDTGDTGDEGAPHLAVAGRLDDDTAAQLAREVRVVAASTGDATVLDMAAQAAAVRLAGRPAGWVDFRRDALAAGSLIEGLGAPLKAAALLALVLLATVAALCAWRAMRYDAQAARYERRQATLYQELFPSGEVPPGIRSRLESQRSRLAALRGEGDETPGDVSALESLRAVAAGLPANVRLRVTELHLAPASIRIEGQARSHGDAETVARGLRMGEAEGRGPFDIDPPTTEHLARGGVAFTLTGRPAAPQPKPAPAGARPQTPAAGGPTP